MNVALTGLMNYAGNLAANGKLTDEIEKYADLAKNVETKLLDTKTGKLAMAPVNAVMGPLQILSRGYDVANTGIDIGMNATKMAGDIGMRATQMASDVGMHATQSASKMGINAMEEAGKLGINAAKNIGEIGTISAVQSLRFATQTALDVGEIAADGTKTLAKSSFDLANGALKKTMSGISSMLDYFYNSVNTYLQRQQELNNLNEYLNKNGNNTYFQNKVLEVFDKIIKQHIEIIDKMESMDKAMLKDKVFVFRMHLFCKTGLLETYYSNNGVIPLPTRRCKDETNAGISKVDGMVGSILVKLKKNYDNIRADLLKIKPSIILQLQQVFDVAGYSKLKESIIQKVEMLMGNVENSASSGNISLTGVRQWLSGEMDVLEKTMGGIEDGETGVVVATSVGVPPVGVAPPAPLDVSSIVPDVAPVAETTTGTMPDDAISSTTVPNMDIQKNVDVLKGGKSRKRRGRKTRKGKKRRQTRRRRQTKIWKKMFE